MNKIKFLKHIKSELKDFNNNEVANILEYYEELINDYCDSGMKEEEAVESLGEIDLIVQNLKTNLVIERSKSKSTNFLKNFIIILSITTSPILIPLGIVFFIIFIIFLITIFTLLIAFSGSSILTLFASIYTIIEMIAKGNEIGMALLIGGSTLFVSVILGILAYGVYKVGLTILNFINKEFSKMIRRRSNKEGVRNG